MTLTRKTPLIRTAFKPAVPKPPKGPRRKLCKHCKTPFTPFRDLEAWCSPVCGLEVAKTRLAAQRAKLQRQERAETKAKLEKFKRLPDYKREAQAAWNSYVRARDAGLPCCSCGAMPDQVFGGSMDCSHYRSRGSAPHLSFHLHNAAAACVKCNRFLGGNVVALRAGLISRLGEDKILAIEADNQIRHFTKEYLIRIKKIFAKKARRTRNAHP